MKKKNEMVDISLIVADEPNMEVRIYPKGCLGEGIGKMADKTMSTRYEFRGFYIPEHMMNGLEAYVNEHRQVGDFLKAVLENNLFDAVGRADEENLKNLPAYVGYLYNNAPPQCWGSKEKVHEWLYGDEK